MTIFLFIELLFSQTSDIDIAETEIFVLEIIGLNQALFLNVPLIFPILP